MSRWKAAAIHLSISIFVGLLVLALLFLVWYPPPYFGAAGGEHLIMVLLGVDLVLGPMLTLILFKSGKRGMLFDLCLIAVIQTSALVYGLFVIAQARPVFIVANVARFDLVAANDLNAADLAKGRKPEFRQLSWTGPLIVAARLPTDSKTRNDLLFSALAGKDIQVFPEYYVTYADEAANLLTRAKSLANLRKSKPDSGPILDAWLKKNKRDEADIVWLPINARKAGLTMLLDAKTGAALDALPFDPW
ncbi:MAG TPA: TfpX/TfpZ family type IV pilin accessory protein [Dokdonella sp.]|uniref:TfpX/TfpZ family type IV pilin accessory protein n=1 Tax=Dokdonella sp. TaxID=2291710 RepID=UPI002D7E9B45|nr:TfpX/TfpZ family type IV pilin accessory protein [Dokdonella sp.]HET9032598.1 TfpX/TfpZ family type IV pilin accessory protein [Dokdonella sp.]